MTKPWLALGAAALFLAAPTMASAQGLHVSAGGGVTILTWDEEERAVARPVALLAVGIDDLRSVSLRLDLRAVGDNRNLDLLGGGVGAGVSGPLGSLPTGYILGTGSVVLATTGAWLSAFGVAAGVAGGARLPLFAELRVESMTSGWRRGRGPPRQAVGSVHGGVRLGGRRSPEP